MVKPGLANIHSDMLWVPGSYHTPTVNAITTSPIDWPPMRFRRFLQHIDRDDPLYMPWLIRPFAAVLRDLVSYSSVEVLGPIVLHSTLSCCSHG